MTTFLFWNINQKPVEKIIANLATLHEVDVLILVECGRLTAVLEALNSGEDVQFHLTESAYKNVVIYTRLSRKAITTISKHEGEKLAVRRLILRNKTDVLLIATHSISKLHHSSVSQSSDCTKLARKIRNIEEDVGHSNTILVGDLNMNPFEQGLIVADGLHAVMSRHIALKKQRKVRQEYYPFFYNPMWSHFGDANDECAGTYYHKGSGRYDTIFWNIFDQVLIRPDLLPMFQDEDLRILSEDGKESFLTKGGLPRKSISDHLPILFKLSV